MALELEQNDVEWDEAIEGFNQALIEEGASPDLVRALTRRLKEAGLSKFQEDLQPPPSPSLSEVPSAPLSLSEFLDADMIQGNLAAASWPPVVSEAVRLLKRKERTLDLSVPFRSLLDIGMQSSWFPGGGIGFPHVSVPQLKEPVLVALRLRTPLPLAERENETVQFLFFLFEGVEKPGRHLQLLARISRIMSSAANRGLLYATTDNWALYQTLKALDELQD